MATNFPSAIDGATQLPQPLGNNLLTSPDHAQGHTNLSLAVIAIENKVGINSGSAAANQLLFGKGAGQSSWGSIGTALTFVNSTFTSGTVNNSALGSPTIASGTISGQVQNNGTIANGVYGTATYLGGTLTLPQIKTHTLGSIAYTGTVSTTLNLDLSTATRHLITMPNSAGSITLTVSNVTPNQLWMLEIKQGTAGLGTINFFSTISWAGSTPPSQTLTASRKDTFGFMTTGAATFDGYTIGQNL